jgi:hypothetical protein
MVFAQSNFDLARDRLQVWFRRSRADNKEIGECGDPAQVDDDDILRLLVGGEFGAGFR